MIDPSVAIIVFFIVAMISLLSEVNRRIGDFLAVFSTIFSLTTVIINIYNSFQGNSLLNIIGLHIVINGYTLFLALVVSLIGLMVTVYSASYIKEKISSYYFFVLITIGSLMGMAYSWNLLWLFIMAEICTICSAPLIAHHFDAKSLEGAIKYLIIQTFAAMFTLIGIGIIYKQAMEAGLVGISVLDIDTIDTLASAKVLSGNLGKIGVIMVFIGFAAKLPLFPIHIWLPDASTVAPAPISSLLHAMMIKIAGIPAFLVLFELGYLFKNAVVLWLIVSILGTITMFICISMAFAQQDLKRILAYDSVGQVGYVVVGLGIGGLGTAYFNTTGDIFWLNVAAVGLTAGFFHLLNHTIFKSLLFFGSGALELKTGTKNLDKLEGLFRAMPLTGLFMLIGSLSISGIPLLNGFISKWMIYNVSIAANEPIIAVTAVFCSAMTLAIFMKVLSTAFLGGSSVKTSIGDPPKSMLFPLIILSMLCIIFGLFPQVPLKYILYPATLSLIPQATLPQVNPYVPVLKFFGGVYDVYWLYTLIATGLCIGYVIYKISPAYERSTTEEKLMPFTGGTLQEPYINIEEARPVSSPFEHPFRPLLNCLKKIHTGFVNLYVSWIAIFAIFMLVCVLMGWI